MKPGTAKRLNKKFDELFEAAEADEQGLSATNDLLVCDECGGYPEEWQEDGWTCFGCIKCGVAINVHNKRYKFGKLLWNKLMTN